MITDASSVAITGTATVGQTLTGSYIYADADNDAEGTSTFLWYANTVAITGTTTKTYVLTSTELGKTITFEVTPVAAAGTTMGTLVMSPSTAAVANTVTSITGNNLYIILERYSIFHMSIRR